MAERIHPPEGGGSPPRLPREDVNSFYKHGHLNAYEMQQFWTAYRGWLAARGFYLQPLRKEEHWAVERWYPFESTCPAPLPYAERCADDSTGQVLAPHLKCVAAQDTCGRDVTIKLVNTYRDEYLIYQDLIRCRELFGEDFRGVLPPVAILDTPYKFSFVVMPTWGDYNPLYTFETIGQVVRFMHCTLKGLSFLHSRRVVHGDIDEQNILTNIYTLWRYTQFAPRLAEHRRTSRMLYCLFDFNYSVIFPLHQPLHECRLLVDLPAMSGTQYRPLLDASLGAYDYDPFAYDVACLGNMFRAQFWMIAGNVPEFALLFDKMTTHVIRDRFTASEALAHFEEVVNLLPDDTLGQETTLDVYWDLENTETYWSLVPLKLATAWREHRTPPLSLGEQLLRSVHKNRMGRTVLGYVRRKLRI